MKDRLSAAVTERMQADHSIQHYQARADAEREKLKAAEEAANDVQAEFEVSSVHSCRSEQI